jgi:hypothetical protein
LRLVRRVGVGIAESTHREREAATARGENAADGDLELLKAMLRRENLRAAYRQVVSNGGAAGVDGMSVGDELQGCGACPRHQHRKVRSHIRGVYGKLQVHSVAEAVSRALRDGLV